MCTKTKFISWDIQNDFVRICKRKPNVANEFDVFVFQSVNQ